MIEQLNARIDALFRDHRRGAAEIVQDAVELFVSIAQLATESPMSAEHLFDRAIRRLAKGQPTMAPVLNLLNRVCHAREESNDDWEKFAESVVALAERRRDLSEEMKRRLIELPPADTLILFSNSSTVAKLALSAHLQFGWPRRVYCGEGRPVMEGLVLAQKLTMAGLDVTLFTDAALMSRVVEADSVWVGGDSLSHEGLVNKVGSRALAMLCRFQMTPFVSMIGTDKFLARAMMPYFGFLPQNPREIGGDESDTLNVHNEYYETIPLDLVDLILTENGVFDPTSLVGSIGEEPVSPLFAKLLQC